MIQTDSDLPLDLAKIVVLSLLRLSVPDHRP